MSLGLLLIESSYPEELREKGGLADRKLSYWSTVFRVNSILRLADANGDGNLSVQESLSALDIANVNVDAAVINEKVVWAIPTSGNQFNLFKSTYSVATMVKDAARIFVETGTFYGYNSTGTSITAVTGLNATYPSSGWDSDTCNANVNKGASVSWTIRESGGAALYQQCAYVNGKKMDIKSFDNRLESAADCPVDKVLGTRTCQFRDPKDISSGNRKRFYCIYARFCKGTDCGKTATSGLSRLMCKTGLLYDGLPADVTAEYSWMNGVQFNWLDTTTQLVGYRIFRSPYSSTSKSMGQLIADIPSISGNPTCGQQLAPVQFADRETSNFPGRRVAYTVAWVDKSTQKTMSGTRILYTQPWASSLRVTVQTVGQVPVSSVDIKIQHYVEISGKLVVDDDFGNLIITTGASGSASSEIRVADAARWFEKNQDFLLTPSMCTGTWSSDEIETRTCNGILHQFDPPSTKASLMHFLTGQFSFVDTTTFSIKGFVIFGDSGRNGASYRSDYSKDDWISSSNCPTMFNTAGNDYQCYCPVGDVDLKLTSLGTTQNLTSSSSGFFTGSAAMFQNHTLSFSGKKNHTFELWEVFTTNASAVQSNSVFQDLGRSSVTFKKVAPDGATSVFNFTANSNKFFVYVDVQARSLMVKILGGDAGVKFITGQRVLVERATCGYRKQLVLLRGEVSSSAVLPAELQVSIPPDSSPRCSGFVRLGSNSGGRLASTPCRVPFPKFVSSSDRLGCSSLPFNFIDEYFTAGINFQMTDLSLSTTVQTTTFTLYTQMCMQAAVLAAPSKNRTLQSLMRCGNSISDRTWPPKWILGSNPDASTMQEALLLSTPTVDTSFKDSEFGKVDGVDERAVFCESDKFNISYRLVEVYPSDATGLNCDWPEDYDANKCTLTYQPEKDFKMETPKVFGPRSVSVSSSIKIRVQVHDGISAAGEPIEAGYNQVEKWGYIHEVNPSDPNPFAPFTNIFEALFSRTNNGIKEEIEFVRRAVTLGVIPEDVPQLFPMTTDPTLIFAVLHDPPGGASFTTLHEGTTLNVNMEIDGMHAGDLSKSENFEQSLGVAKSVDMLLAPFGVGINTKGFGMSAEGGWGVHSTKPSISVSRGSAQGFEIGFSFDVELSTSESPELAGQPSDLILGGGMDLQVIRAIKVKLASVPDPMNGMCSILGMTVSEWLPDKITTWLMTPYQIEMTIERLFRQRALEMEQQKIEGAAVKENQKILKGIQNWQKVLKDYRAPLHQASLTSIQDAVVRMVNGVQVAAKYHGLDKMFSEFNSGMDSPSKDAVTFIQNGLADLKGLGSGMPPLVQDLNGDHGILGMGDASGMVNKLSAKLKDISRGNCNGGDMFGMGRLCDTVSNMQTSVNLVNNLLSICDFKMGIAAVNNFCQKKSDKNLPSSVFDALTDADRLVTFTGGGSSTTITYSITQGKEGSQTVEMSQQASKSFDTQVSGCLDLFRRRLSESGRNEQLITNERRRLDDKPTLRRQNAQHFDEPEGGEEEGGESACRRRLGIKTTLGSSLSAEKSVEVKLERSATRSAGAEHSISFTLKDDDASDFFAVRIFNDDLHGTPAFETVGGISSGPGETGTTKADSHVTIKELRHYCTEGLWCKNVKYGKPAYIGVVIQNISPLRQDNAYTLFRKFNTQPWQDGKNYCGEPGYSGGLIISLDSGDGLPAQISLPFGQREVILRLEPTVDWKRECLQYTGVEIGIVAGAEAGGTTAGPNDTPTYQYSTTMDKKSHQVSVVYPEWNMDNGEWLPSTRAVSGDASYASFSVSWAPNSASDAFKLSQSSSAEEQMNTRGTVSKTETLNELGPSKQNRGTLAMISLILVAGGIVIGFVAFKLSVPESMPAMKDVDEITGEVIFDRKFPADPEEKERLLGF